MIVKKVEKGKWEINPQMCPLMRLLVVSRKLGKIFKNKYSKLNVTQSQASILLMLSETGEIAQSFIGKYLQLERSTVSRDLVRLIDKGYLLKSANGVSPMVVLTEQGVEMTKLVTIEWRKGYDEAFDLLGEKGMAAINDLELTMKT